MRDSMLSTAPALSDDELRRCLLMLCLFVFLTAISAQAFITTQPLLITEEDALDYPVVVSGYVQTVMVIGAVISYLSLNPMLNRFTPRGVAIASQVVRIGSASVYAIFIVSLSGEGSAGSVTALLGINRGVMLAIIFAARFVFGLSMGAAAIPAIWIGHRFDVKERPKAVAKYSACLGCGMILGPVFGSTLSLVAPGHIYTQSAMPGWAAVVISTLLVLLMARGFPDTQMLPQGRGKPAEEEVLPDVSGGAAVRQEARQEARARRTCGVIILITFLVLFGAMALEGTAPIILERDYCWLANAQYRFFVPVGVSTLLAGVIMIDMQERLNWSILSTLLTCGQVGALFLAVNLHDMSKRIEPTRFVIGVVIALVCSSLSFTLHSSLLSIKAPPKLMSAIFSINASLGQIGRSIGPLATAELYQYVADSNHEEPSCHYSPPPPHPACPPPPPHPTSPAPSPSTFTHYACNYTIVLTPCLGLLGVSAAHFEHHAASAGAARSGLRVRGVCVSQSAIGFLFWRRIYGRVCDPSLRSIRRASLVAAEPALHSINALDAALLDATATPIRVAPTPSRGGLQ